MIPDLPPRFLAPEGWRTGEFTNPSTGHRIHFGSASPAGPVRGIVVALGGLSEFSEKYYELTYDMLDRGFAVWSMDWPYQGRSDRLGTNPQMRHSDGYDSDLADLHHFIVNHVRSSAVGNLPLILIAHSMGGNLGLRYMAAHPDIFTAAAVSAPLLGIKDLAAFPGVLLDLLLICLTPLHKHYIPGGRDWHEAMRKSDGTDIFSSDPLRDRIHNAWCKADPALQVGNPTLRWVYETVKSCAALKRKGVLERITLPVLLAFAGQEKLVDNDAIRKAAKRLPSCTLLELAESRHEILMECDAIRDRFLKALDNMLETYKIGTPSTE